MPSVLGFCEGGNHVYAKAMGNKEKDCPRHRKAASKGFKPMEQDDYQGKKPWKKGK